MKNILILAPHADDEVLGCGGIIKKHSLAGDKVVVAVMTRGSEKLFKVERILKVRDEARKAHRILGVAKTIFHDFPAPYLDVTPKADISMVIREMIDEHAIDTMYLPHQGDIHHDHDAVFSAGLVAARPDRKDPVARIYAYETLTETEWAPPFPSSAFIPNVFVDVSDEFASKLEAMACFGTQLREFPSARSLEGIEALAKFRGATVGRKRAEAFMLIREIQD